MNPLPRPLQIGVIGAGGIAQSSHLPALAWLRAQGWPVSVAALADPQPERIAQAKRFFAPAHAEKSAPIAAFSSGAALLAAGNIDAVLLLTPPAQTAPLLEIALTGGIPALAEKPAAETAQTLARLVQREKEANNPFVCIAYNRRSLPLASVFRTRLRAMKTRPLHVEARLWRARRTDTIFYRDTMVHALDFLLWSVGPLYVQHIQWSPLRGPGELPAGLRVSFSSTRSEIAAHLDVRPAVGRDLESYEVLGDRQTIELTYPPAGAAGRSTLSVYETGEPKEIVCAPPDGFANDPNGLTERGFLPQLAYFLRAVAGDPSTANVLCTLAEAHDNAMLKETILASLPENNK